VIESIPSLVEAFVKALRTDSLPPSITRLLPGIPGTPGITTPGMPGGMMMTEDSEKGSSVYGGLARTDSTNSLADLTLAADAVLTQGRDVRARVGFDYASDAIGERERERGRKEREIDWAMNIDLEALEKNTKVRAYVRVFCFILDDNVKTICLFSSSSLMMFFY
jgi:hypothetical protein